MNATIVLLQELQKLEAGASHATSEQQQRMTELRTLIPAPVLAHYNRMVVNGRKPIAEVRHGNCSGCHLRLPSWVQHAANDGELHVCDNCGAYLVFVKEEEPVAPKRAPRISNAKKLARLAMIRAAVAH